MFRSPGLIPITDTSARSPPFVAGSIVTVAVIVPVGTCSQYSPRVSSSTPWYTSEEILPFRFSTTIFTIPLSIVHESALSTRVTGAFTVTFATFGACAVAPQTSAAPATNDINPPSTRNLVIARTSPAALTFT